MLWLQICICVVPIALIDQYLVALLMLFLQGRSSRHNCKDKSDLSLPDDLIDAHNAPGLSVAALQVTGWCSITS